MSFFSRITNWLNPLAEGEIGESYPAPKKIPAVAPHPNWAEPVNLPRFSNLANDSDSSDFGRAADVRRRLSQAFPLARPISSLRQFAGRRALLATAVRAIEERRLHVVLYGDRGMGKTSLLNIIGLLAQDARYHVRYTSCSEGNTFDQVFRAVARDIPLLYYRDADPTSDQVESGKSLADLLDASPLTPSRFSDLLDGVSGTRLLLVLDEFDRADSVDFSRLVAELIKNLSDRSSRAQILIGGVGSNLAELLRHIPSIQRSLLGIPVLKMTEEEIEEVLTIGVAVSRIRFASQAKQILVEASNGSPYLANLFAHQATSRAIDRGQGEISVAAVCDSLGETLSAIYQRIDDDALAQFIALKLQLADRKLAKLARHAIDHFNRLEPEDTEFLVETLGEKMDPRWLDGGNFVFVEDGIPLALWLSTIIDRLSAKPSEAVGAH